MKKIIALVLTLALLLSLCACGGKSEQAKEQAAESAPAAAESQLVPEEELLKGYQSYMTDWMWEEIDKNESLMELYEQLQACIDSNDYSAYPGTLFFDGSFSIGNPMTYEEYCAAQLEQAAADADYIHISTAADWRKIADNPGGKYMLDKDIDNWDEAEDAPLEPIGSLEQPFTGELNGNGHSIAGTLAYTGKEESWGLFACNEGRIHDLNLGTVRCDALTNRFYDYQDVNRTLASLAEEELPDEQTRYYGLLCGCNRGTIETVAFNGYNSTPDFNLLNNSNECVDLGLICGRNEGTIRGVTILSNDVNLRSMDLSTQVNAGLVCGSLSAKGAVEEVSLEESDIFIQGWGDSGVVLLLSPAVYAGLVAGEAADNAVIASVTHLEHCSVDAEHTLPDVDLRLGGIVGNAKGNLSLSGIDAYLDIGVDTWDELEGYEIQRKEPACGAGLIGCAKGDVTLTDCTLRDFHMVHTTRNKGGTGLVGGFVGRCGGTLTASNVVMTKGSSVSINAQKRDTYAGGLCGRCDGAVDAKDSQLSICFNAMFDGGKTLYEANLCGYVAGDAAFSGVQTDCGSSGSHGGMGGEGIYYFASLVACLEGECSAENCDLTVDFRPMIDKDASIYGALDTDGFYNRPH